MTECPECKDRRVVGAGQAAEPCERCAVDLTFETRQRLMMRCFERLQVHSKVCMALLLADMIGHSGSTQAEVEAFEAKLNKQLLGWGVVGREYNATKRARARIAALENGRQKKRRRRKA